MKTAISTLPRPTPPVPSEFGTDPELVMPSPDPPEIERDKLLFRPTEDITTTWGRARTWIAPQQVYSLVNCHWPTENAFNLKTLRDYMTQLKKFDGFPQPVALVVRSMEGVGFCPGADLIDLLRRDVEHRKTFYKACYQASYMTATTGTPLFTCVQGNTMGLGAGLTMHAPLFRLVLDDGVWAMPNTLYGAFPDCGSTYVLPRLDGEVGMYLALTGKRLESFDIINVGLATHYASSSSLEEFMRWSSRIKQPTLEQIHEAFQPAKRHSSHSSAIGRIRTGIDRCFGKNTLEEVFQALRDEKEHEEWAKNTLKRLESCCPTMLHVTFRLQRIGRYLTSLEEALHLEYRVARKMVSSADFVEGIKARLVHKCQPKWSYTDIYSVPNSEVLKYLEVEKDNSDMLHLEPCHPGKRPTPDPYKVYDLEFEYMQEREGPRHFWIQRLFSRLGPPEYINVEVLSSIFREMYKAGGMAQTAAEGLQKVEQPVNNRIMETLGIFSTVPVTMPFIQKLNIKVKILRNVDLLLRRSVGQNRTDAVKIVRAPKIFPV